MGRYAQTILQLHAQAAELGWSDGQRARLARAYRLACELLTGQHRGSGKPFVDHLVGTASILASHGAPHATVLAGLLHAAYEFGDFGDGREGAAPSRRNEVVAAVGDDVERRIHAYWSLRWKDATVAAVLARAHALDAEEREAVMMRIANELDDHLELGILYCADAARRLEQLERRADRTAAIARSLGWTRLADELAAAYEACRTATLPAGIAASSGSAPLLMPRSCAQALMPTLRRRFAASRRLAIPFRRR
jgi:(p)ppGpp synthase/HD superfamily hydrolase